MMGKRLKQQSALELLTTYSWALLIIAIFVAAVAVINSARPATNYLASSCSIEPLLPCTQTLLTYNTISPIKFTVLFQNNLGETMYFPLNSINITVTNIGNKGVSYSLGNCTPSLALQGNPVLCSAYIPGTFKPAIGTQETILFSLNYELCSTTALASCISTQYRSTGQSSQTMAPSATSFHLLKMVASPASGTVDLNGVTYLNNANVLLLTNNYNVYAIPPSGYKFSSWGISVGSGGGTSSLSSASAQNSVLALGSNATLTANFGAIGSTSTVTLTSTSTTTTTSTWVTTTTIAPALLAGAITPSAPTLDSGQSVTLTSAASGGTTPYSYSWYSGGSSTCTSDSAVGGQTSSTYAPSPSSSTYYCYQVGDSSTPQQFTKSATDLVTVNSALSAGAVTASGTTLDSGQTVTLTSHPSGGTTAYSYVWYSGSSATCSSDGAVGGQTSSTYAPSPSSSTYYCYQVTDSATSPESAKSATILITVNSALAAGAITPSSPSIYTGGSGVTLSSAASGGTTAYSYQW
ncbi:MAG: hypothetical protein KGH66_00535, partial [Candidatus Micrarchaeota archaeon]|nr:hypothetical protein [Candidatus Micrarchaeota archaeon]